MVEKCETECKQIGGAIFCDGQFINADNAKSCADQLDAELSIEIDLDAAAETVGDAAEDVGEEAEDTAKDVGDSAEKTADCVDEKACSVSHVGSGRSAGTALGLVPFAALLLARRRRNRRG